MPPNKKLADNVIADFEEWVRIGAPDPRTGGPAIAKRVIDIEEGRKFWAFQPPKKPRRRKTLAGRGPTSTASYWRRWNRKTWPRWPMPTRER
jgi:hypothetical protein